MKAEKRVVFVVGTTASGKSQWALEWAERFGGVIVNCDSVQLYKSLDIGAAKPTAQERARVPHYLYDYIPEGETMTAGNYTRDFFECLEKLPEGPVFVVGGTGFYFQAIEKGMYPVRQTPRPIQEEIAKILQTEEGAAALYQEFKTLDPEAAKKVHPDDHYRLGRAMELYRAEGKTLTQIQKEFTESQNPFPYPLLKVGPLWERDILRERIRVRTKKMLAAGLVNEVRSLLGRGLGGWSALQSVGYKEVLMSLQENWSAEKLFEEIVTNTAQLAKKQRTWFQRDKAIEWFPGDDKGFVVATERVKEFLNQSRS